MSICSHRVRRVSNEVTKTQGHLAIGSLPCVGWSHACRSVKPLTGGTISEFPQSMSTSMDINKLGICKSETRAGGCIRD